MIVSAWIATAGSTGGILSGSRESALRRASCAPRAAHTALTCRRTGAGIERRGWGDVNLRRFNPGGINRFTQGRRTDGNAG